MIAAANARNMYANTEAEEHYTHAIEVSARLAESDRAEAQFRIYEKRAALYLSTSRFDLSIADGREMIQRARGRLGGTRVRRAVHARQYAFLGSPLG
jgi:hypothetical protein